MPAIPGPRPARIPALDIARGIAIIGMVIYHFGWNLVALDLIAVDLGDFPLWIAFGHAIAAGFLAMVGMGLVLAHGTGFGRERFLARLALVAGGAALVSAGTYWAFPDRFIFFGILHHIALASVLALAFLRLPWPLLAISAALAMAMPVFFRLDALSAPWLVWLGLGTRVPATNDFVPVFPWFGCVLAGMAMARFRPPVAPLEPASPSRPARLLAWLGRRSLAIYLLHQPVLYGGLALIAAAIQPPPDREARGFLEACRPPCEAQGGDALTCASLCGCMVDRLRAEGLWKKVLTGPPDASLRPRIDALVRQCTPAAAP